MSPAEDTWIAPGGGFKIEYVKIELHSFPVKESNTQITCLCVIMEASLELPCIKGYCHVAV